MRSASLFTAGLLALSNVIAASSPTEVQQRSAHKRWNDTPGFVYAEDGKFKINGKDFFFAGATAYWLTQVQCNDDITKTLDDIAANDLEVVRIWGFREVVGETNDDPATFTQQWVNGEQKCNQAGIDRIKFILDEAQKRGIFVQLALTNNWAPDFPSNATAKFPPGYLSNSYGGIDTYVQQIIKPGCDHDVFFSDEAVKNSYKKWLSCIIPQFSSHPALFAWELANDPRCKGADGTTTSGNCNAQTITRWTADTAKFVKGLDPNHMTASGDGGFFCTDCEKLFPRNNLNKRDSKHTGYLTSAMVREQNKARQMGPSFKRENDGGDIGPSYDGSIAIDTEDILGIPEIAFSTLQLFPDQNTYDVNGVKTCEGPPPGGAGGDNFKQTLEAGLQWIKNHAGTAQAFGKPSLMTAMGLVNEENSPNFVPFDSDRVADTVAPTDPHKADGYRVKMVKRSQAISTNEQQDIAYGDWTDQSVNSGINGVLGYQWGETDLTARDSSKRSIKERQSNRSRNSGSDSQGFSPDDGYRITHEGTKTIFKNTGKKQKRKSGRDSG